MTIQECVDQWVEMSDEERAKWGNALFDVLTPISQGELASLQTMWPLMLEEEYADIVGNLDAEFKAFMTEQQKRLRHCLVMETSQIGQHVREAIGLKPISMNDPITGAVIDVKAEENGQEHDLHSAGPESFGQAVETCGGNTTSQGR